MNENTYHFKLLLLGHENSGKSSLLNKFTEDSFTNTYTPTHGTEFQIKQIENIKLTIFDNGRKLSEESSKDVVYRNHDAILIVFDITNKESFKSANDYLKKVRDINNDNTPPILLVGTKSDLSDQRQVYKQEIDKFVKDNAIFLYHETSAKTGKYVNDLFKTAANVAINNKITDENTSILTNIINAIPDNANSARENAKIALRNLFINYQHHLIAEDIHLKKFNSWFKQSINALNHSLGIPKSNNINPIAELTHIFNQLKSNSLIKKYFELKNYKIPNSQIPISCQIEILLEHIKDGLHEAKITDKTYKPIYTQFNIMYPSLQGYVKMQTAIELQTILSKPNTDAAIDEFEQRINSADTRRILKLNRQSTSEKVLKWAALFTAIGALGLVIKRLYDTHGTSINFFKPVSQNLVEDATALIDSVTNTKNKI